MDPTTAILTITALSRTLWSEKRSFKTVNDVIDQDFTSFSDTQTKLTMRFR